MIKHRSVVSFLFALLGAVSLHVPMAIAQSEAERPATESNAFDWLQDSNSPIERPLEQGEAEFDTPAQAEVDSADSDLYEDAEFEGDDTERAASEELPSDASDTVTSEISESEEPSAPVTEEAEASETGAPTEQAQDTAPAVEPSTSAETTDVDIADTQPATTGSQEPSQSEAEVTVEVEQPSAVATDAHPASETAQDDTASQTINEHPSHVTEQESPGAPAAAQAEVAPISGQDDEPPSLAEPAPATSGNEPRPVAVEAEPAASQDLQQAELPDPKDITLNVATWTGAYGQAQERAIFRPFVKEKGYQLETVAYDGDYEALEKQADEPKWNLVDMNGEAMIRACEEGRLERLDHSILASAPDGTPLSKDFLPGAVHPCGIASVVWSAVIVFDERLETQPASIADFFNTAKIPGKRFLPKQPRYSLELALLADGVPPAEVYSLLKTRDGQDRAFAKLLTIKDDILWWEKPSEIFEQIAEKNAAMGLGFNGRAFMAIEGGKQPLKILWDGQIYTFDYWAIPQGAPFQHAAKEFIRFATSPQSLAEQARWIPYGPARHSAVELVGRHAELNLEMKPYLPTSRPNLAKALGFDGAFWRANESVLQQRFAEWIKGRQLPPQKQAAISQ